MSSKFRKGFFLDANECGVLYYESFSLSATDTSVKLQFSCNLKFISCRFVIFYLFKHIVTNSTLICINRFDS